MPSDTQKSSSPNKNWGEFGVLIATGLGIGVVGMFSEGTINNTVKLCPSRGSGGADDATGYTSKMISAVTAASAVAIGAGVSIIVFALSNKFNLLTSPNKRSIFMMILAAGLMTIGSISLSIKLNTKLTEEEKLLAQSRLGGIVLGFGLGITLIAIPKLIVGLSRAGGLEGDSAYLTRVNQLTVSGSTTVMALFATIVGSWSWNIYGKCKKVATEDPDKRADAESTATFNGLGTVLAALLCVYSGVYFGFRAAGSPIADMLSNFRPRAKTAAAAPALVTG